MPEPNPDQIGHGTPLEELRETQPSLSQASPSQASLSEAPAVPAPASQSRTPTGLEEWGLNAGGGVSENSTTIVAHPNATPTPAAFRSSTPGGSFNSSQASPARGSRQQPPLRSGPGQPAAGRGVSRAAAATAAILAVLVTGVVFTLVLSIARHHAAATPGGQKLASVGSQNQGPGLASSGSAPVQTDPDAIPRAAGAQPGSQPAPGIGAAGPGSQVQIYWRFATRDYFASHPTAHKSSIVEPEGYAASVVRIDVENNGASPVAIDPQAFVLTVPEAAVPPERGMLPGLLSKGMVPAHGSIQGWLLFIKPWRGNGPDAIQSWLNYTGLPGVQVNLSHFGAHPTAGPIIMPIPNGAGDEAPTLPPVGSHSHQRTFTT